MVQIAPWLRGNLGRSEAAVVAQRCQPAVSRISNPQASGQFERNSHFERLPTGSRRYGKLETCTTFGCGFRRVVSLRFACILVVIFVLYGSEKPLRYARLIKR